MVSELVRRIRAGFVWFAGDVRVVNSAQVVLEEAWLTLLQVCSHW